MDEDVGGIIGDGREVFGEGRDEVGEGVEGCGAAGEEEAKLEKSASSTNLWIFAKSGYCGLLVAVPAPARRCGRGKEGAWPCGGGGAAWREGRGSILGGNMPSWGGKQGGAPARIAFCSINLWVNGSRNGYGLGRIISGLLYLFLRLKKDPLSNIS